MNQYSLQSKLGQGAFSVVYKVKRKEDGLEYAMKKMRIMSFSDKEVANCLNEVRILASIDANHIVSYKDSFFDELTNTFCIVTQFLEGGDVSHIISKHKNMKKPIPQALIWQVAYHALQGLQTLHKMKILHRDIKSANIFLTKDQTIAKLGDMNVSIVSSNGMARTQTGTPYYASPEVWNEKPYSAKCDLWSLGCVLYQMTTLRPPFMSNEMRALKKTIMSGLYKKIPNSYSSELDSLIKMCLRVDPRDRPSAEQLLNNQVFDKFTKNTIQVKNEMKMLEKIQAPKKREFRIIKDRLPRNRFSSEKSLTNQSCYSEKEKENLPNNESITGSTRILKKANLPSLKRPTSATSKGTIILKDNKQIGVIQPVERPPLPRNRALRG